MLDVQILDWSLGVPFLDWSLDVPFLDWSLDVPFLDWFGTGFGRFDGCRRVGRRVGFGVRHLDGRVLTGAHLEDDDDDKDQGWEKTSIKKMACCGGGGGAMSGNYFLLKKIKIIRTNFYNFKYISWAKNLGVGG